MNSSAELPTVNMVIHVKGVRFACECVRVHTEFTGNSDGLLQCKTLAMPMLLHACRGLLAEY